MAHNWSTVVKERIHAEDLPVVDIVSIMVIDLQHALFLTHSHIILFDGEIVLDSILIQQMTVKV